MRLLSLTFCSLLAGALLVTPKGCLASSDTLYIVPTTFTSIDSVTWDMIVFSEDGSGAGFSYHIRTTPSDSFQLIIINLDTHEHRINVGMNPSVSMDAGDTAIWQLNLSNIQLMNIVDTSFNQRFKALGLSTFIHVTSTSTSCFYWHVMEFESSRMESLHQGSQLDWSTYDPDYFTINGQSNPHINSDPMAKVVGNVGDTLFIAMHGAGMSHHSMHFHGYHVELIYSTRSSNVIGRLKDTFPLYRGESILVQLIPDKPGEYPVHDHNLVAVSGGGVHPNGMFLTMNIDP